LAAETEAKANNEDIEELLLLLTSNDFRDTLSAFLTANVNPNFKYWWSYMDMIEILLMFTRAQREGNWELHLHAFQRMLPYFIRYDHTNYTRSGTVYINEMHHLPPEVERI